MYIKLSVIKYLVNVTMYNEFILEITSLINKYYKRVKDVLSVEEFLNYIGLPKDYEELRRNKHKNEDDVND